MARAELSAHPNPFNPRTRVRFALSEQLTGPVQLAIYNATGRRLQALALETVSSPNGASLVHGSLDWLGRDASDRSLPSGVYLLRLESNGQVLAQRSVTLLR
jgi:hypothetical protein